MRRILLVLTTAALLAAMVAASTTPAFADIDGLDNESIFNNDNDHDGIFDEDDEDNDDEDDGDEIDDVEVGDAFLDDGDICVPVVIEFEDGSTDTDIECEDAEDIIDAEDVDLEDVDLEDAFFSI